jgi:hypothetical protein
MFIQKVALDEKLKYEGLHSQVAPICHLMFIQKIVCSKSCLKQKIATQSSLLKLL